MAATAGISRSGRAELATVLEGGRRFVTSEDAAEVLNLDGDAAAKKLARWAGNGWLRRVRRGLYLAVPADAAEPAAWSEDALVIAAQVWPCYFTGWTAASEWSLTDQVFRTTVLKTTSRVRASAVRVLDHDYLISSATDMTWGLKSEWRNEYRLRFADPARTVVEILDTPRLGGGIRHCAEILSAYLDDHDPDVLITYADQLGNRTVFKRLGYIVEILRIDLPELLDRCRGRLSKGVSVLDPDGPTVGRVVVRWGLRINVRIGVEEPS
jgi:predicted transcriptional regulator of viral defense system